MIRKIKRIPHYLQPQIENAISEGLAWVYRSPDDWPQRAAFGPLFRLGQLERRLKNRRYPGQAYLASGLSARNGLPLEVLFMGKWTPGDDVGLNYFEHALFQEGTAERKHLGSFPDTQYRRLAEKLSGEVDLVILVDTPALVWTPRSGEWALGPSDVRMVMDFKPGQCFEEIISHVHHQNNLKRMRKARLTYRVSSREEDFQFFYHRMHVPLIKNRYKDAGGVSKEKDMVNLFKNKHGFILFIEDPEGTPVSGGLCFIWRDVFYYYINGVLDGDSELINKGGLSAWYYYGMKMAYELGCKRFDSGLVRGYLTDGVYIHKSLWGLRPSLDYWYPSSVLLWAPQGSPAGLEWMKANPLIPQFARWGGPEMAAMYAALKQEAPAEMPSVEKPAAEKAPERKGQRKPAETPKAEPEKSGYRFEAFDRAPEGVGNAIRDGLERHNQEILGAETKESFLPMTLTVRDRAGKLAGGLLGYFLWDFLHIDVLWVDPEHRGQDLGTQLLRMAEKAARQHGARMIKLETTSFQAVDFYRPLGYEVAGQIDDLPEGHSWYYLKKDLTADVPAPRAAQAYEKPLNGSPDSSEKLSQMNMKRPVDHAVKKPEGVD